MLMPKALTSRPSRMYLTLEKTCTPHLVAVEAVRVFGAPLVVGHLVLRSRGLEREVSGCDLEARVLRFKADGAVAARRHWRGLRVHRSLRAFRGSSPLN
jgi:hypothetical protein